MGDYLLKEQLATKVGLTLAEIDRLEGAGVIRPVARGGCRYYSARDAYKARFVKFLLTHRKMAWDEAVERASSQVLYEVS
jgi:DNA-binding transcriptional MerR regulator